MSGLDLGKELNGNRSFPSKSLGVASCFLVLIHELYFSFFKLRILNEERTFVIYALHDRPPDFHGSTSWLLPLWEIFYSSAMNSQTLPFGNYRN